jgi:hypothetical protein
MKNRMLKIACQPEMSRWIEPGSPNVPFCGVIRSDGFLKHGAQSSREKLHSKILFAIVRTNTSLAEGNELVFMGLRGAEACFLRSQNAKK